MLSRSESGASARLRRAKSTSSVSRKSISHLSTAQDRESTHQHATTAAYLAFERAKNDPRTLPIVSRTQSARSPRRSRLSGEGSHLRTRNSWQVAGPRRSSTREQLGVPSTPASQFTSTSKSSLKTSPQSFDLSVTSAEKRFSDRFDGYGVPANARIRQISAIQKHKSSNAATSETLTPVSLPRARRLTVPAPAARESQTDEAIIAIARDRYLREHQMTPLKKKASFLAMPFRNLNRKIRKDPHVDEQKGAAEASQARTQESAIESLQHVLSPSSDQVRKTSLGILSSDAPKNRRVSSSFASLKQGWKRTFGRSSSGQTQLPAQQVSSKTLHCARNPSFSVSTSDPRVSLEDWRKSPAATPWPPPSLPPPPPPHPVDVHRSVSSRHENRGARDDHDQVHCERSRVTSWTDSTRRNTLVMLDSDHLPIIQESPESRKPVAALNTSGSSQGPPPIPTRRSSSHFSTRGKIDSQRLVSALIRHKKENSSNDRPVRRSSISSLFRRSSEIARMGAGDGSETKPPGIRNLSTDLPFGHFAEGFLPPLTDQYGDADPAVVISPSIYSARPRYTGTITSHDSSSSHIPSTPPGVATVSKSEAVSKWSLEKGKNQHRYSTSNEWRLWAADEFASLNGRSSFSIPGFLHSRVQPSSLEAVSGNRTIPKDSTMNPPNIQHSIRRKPMNPINYDSFAINGDSSSSKSDVNAKGNRGISTSSQMGSTEAAQDRWHQLSQVHNVREPSNVDLFARYGDDHYVLPGEENTARKSPNFHPTKVSRLAVPVNALQSTQDGGSPRQKRRKEVLDENFLLRIRRGPYDTSSNSLARMPTSSLDSFTLPKRTSASPFASVDKENTPPSHGQKMATAFLSNRLALAPARNTETSSPAFL